VLNVPLRKPRKLSKALESRNYVIEKHDSGEADGLAEASYYSVLSPPTLVLVMEYENGSCTETMLGRWAGIPDINEINEVLRENNI